MDQSIVGDARSLNRRWRSHSRIDHKGPHDVRIGFAASFVLDPLLSYTGALLLEEGRTNPLLINANYNQLIRVCIDPKTEFGEVRLDMIVLAWRIEDIANLDDPQRMADACGSFLRAVDDLRARFSGAIVLTLPPRPRPLAEPFEAFSRPSSVERVWLDALAATAALIAKLPNMFVLDFEKLIARLGEAACLDDRNEMLYRQPYTEGFYVAVAREIVRLYRAGRTEPKKCIAVDCDNTLWGGIVGEDGVAGIQLSDDYPGRPFREFQRQLRALRRSGVFVALCTKNNPDDITEIFRTHSAMALTMEDISAARVNWRPKSENLKEIADELSIGLDSIVFVDDNPFEIEEVRAHVPEVTCIQVPEDFSQLPVVFKEVSRMFDRLDITNDDRKRVDMMRLSKERQDLSQKLTEVEFLQSLALEVEIRSPSISDFARVSQLINKTNQFNLTSRRYSFEEVTALAHQPDYEIYCATVRDRFGEYGLVGVGIVRYEVDAAEFDSLLMSCRVLGRGIETALLSYGVALAEKKGKRFIKGTFIPTRKNGMVADLYPRHGFEMILASTVQCFIRDTTELKVPDYLTVRSVGCTLELTPRVAGGN
jgi:FkbH-like protein